MAFIPNSHRFDPYKNFKFRIRWNGKIVAAAHEISGIVAENSKKIRKTKQPGLNKFSNIMIKRGVTNDPDFLNWITSVINSGPGKVSKKPGDKTNHPTDFSPVTIERGITHDSDFLDWENSVTASAESRLSAKQNKLRREFEIELVDENGRIIFVCILKNVFPVKISASNLNAKGNEVAIETIELEHEGVEIQPC